MSTNSFVAPCPKCGEDTCLNNVGTRPMYHSKECWSCGWFSDEDDDDYEEGYRTENERLHFEQDMTECWEE